MLKTLISSGYSLINAHMCHIEPNHNHCPISVILTLIHRDSIFQVGKNMDNKSDEQLLIRQATIESNRKYSDEKMKNLTE